MITCPNETMIICPDVFGNAQAPAPKSFKCPVSSSLEPRFSMHTISSITETSIHLFHPSALRKSFCAFAVYFLQRFRCVIRVGTEEDYVDQIGNWPAMFRIFFDAQSLCQGD